MAQTKEEQEVMPLSDVLNELAKMKNITRAFERADEVTVALSRAEGKKAEIDKEIRDNEEKAKALQASVQTLTAAQAKTQKEYDDYQKQAADKLAAAKKQFDADMAEIGVQYSQMTVSAKNKMGEEIKAKQVEIDAIDAKLSDKKRDLRVIEAQVEAEQKKAVL